MAAAQRFLADHYDTYQKKEEAQRADAVRACGPFAARHERLGQPPYGIAGAVQNKVADATMAKRMSLEAAMGHPCGTDYRALPHLARGHRPTPGRSR